MNKEKKIILLRISLAIMIISIILLFLIKIGIITFPKFVYEIYFNTNKEDFEKIINYVEKNPGNSFWLYDDDLDDISQINDVNVEASIERILGSVFISGISNSITGNEVKVRFIINNLFTGLDEAIEIVYCTEPLTQETNWYNNDETVVSYSYYKIDEDWYYCYRSK